MWECKDRFPIIADMLPGVGDWLRWMGGGDAKPLIKSGLQSIKRGLWISRMALQDAIFVLGAGASRPFGFPCGGDLRDWLITRDFPEIIERYPTRMINRFKDELRWSMGYSIDRFLQRCEASGRPELVEVGMASIAAALLPVETQSVGSPPNWYAQLFSALTSPDNVEAGGRLQIITFNYDRSLEFFFIQGLKAAENLNITQAAERFRALVDVVHVYGQLGHLPEAIYPGVDGVPYGSRTDINRAAASIRIIGRPSDTAVAERLPTARFVVFVGFGFLDENVTLLGLQSLNARVIISTGCGISDGVRFTLHQQCGQHVWFFGGETTGAEDFFNETDLFRQLRRPDALTTYAQNRRR